MKLAASTVGRARDHQPACLQQAEPLLQRRESGQRAEAPVERHAMYASLDRSTIAGTILVVSLNGGPDLPPYPAIKADPETLRRRTCHGGSYRPRTPRA